MKHLVAALIAALSLALSVALPVAALADGERAGVFDHYVLALSWSPNWCAREGDRRDSAQCEQDFGWVVHGLWPQYDRGWPAYCPTLARAPSRQMTRAQADIFGTGGAAWYQWKKHGTCSGLDAGAYYDTARSAFSSVTRPEVLRKIDRTFSIPAKLIEDAFLQANPDWTPDMITVTCKDGYIQEARICLTKDLNPRPCGADTRRDCTLQDALFEPIR